MSFLSKEEQEKIIKKLLGSSEPNPKIRAVRQIHLEKIHYMIAEGVWESIKENRTVVMEFQIF